MDETATATLAVNGDVDMTNAAKYIAQAKLLIEAEATQSFVIDLGGAEFVDSQGIGFLIESRNMAMKKGIDLALRAVPARVQRVLQITGLAPVFTIVA